jgi:hypothetical protein
MKSCGSYAARLDSSPVSAPARLFASFGSEEAKEAMDSALLGLAQHTFGSEETVAFDGARPSLAGLYNCVVKIQLI